MSVCVVECECEGEWERVRVRECAREFVRESARSKLKGNQDDLIQLRFHLETESSSDRRRKEKKMAVEIFGLKSSKICWTCESGKVILPLVLRKTN